MPLLRQYIGSYLHADVSVVYAIVCLAVAVAVAVAVAGAVYSLQL